MSDCSPPIHREPLIICKGCPLNPYHVTAPNWTKVPLPKKLNLKQKTEAANTVSCAN